MDNWIIYLIVLVVVVAGIFYMKPDLFEKVKQYIMDLIGKKGETKPGIEPGLEKPLL